MFERRIPENLRHPPTPSVHGFGRLNGLEAIARGILISVYPLEMYRALGDAGMVSLVYFGIGVVSLLIGLLVPWVNRIFPRRWVYSCGALLAVIGALLASSGGALLVIIGLSLGTFATVITFVCFNAYVLDYVARHDLGRCETYRMFYSALGWTVGPVAGVALLEWWAPVSFYISAAASTAMLVLFWSMRLGNGKLITRAKAPTVNPVQYLGRFFVQPRLVAGWIFAVMRSCGWWVYVVYLPIFAVESGLGNKLGGTLLSFTNAALFATPLALWLLKRSSLKTVVRGGFLAGTVLFVAAGLLSSMPWLAVSCLFFGSLALILLDVSGGLPFLMAVKPSERTEMSAVYSSFRDVSGILTPGAAALVLLVAPLSGVFYLGGLALFASWVIAGSLHPRLGKGRIAASA